MFSLKSIAKGFQDRAGSVRNFGIENDSEEEEQGEVNNQDKVDVMASKVKAVAKVKGKSFDLLQSSDNVIKIQQTLTSEKSSAPGAPLSANVELEAEIGFVGDSANAVSSAVQTTSFLFEQLLGDLDALSRRPTLKERTDRTELVENFHSHMTDVLKSLASAQGTGLDEEFDSAESIISKGAEAYIETVRRLLKNDMQDNVTVWYRGLKYDAFIPMMENSSNSRNTVGSMCYDITLGPIVNLVNHFKEALFPSTPEGYERFSDDQLSGKTRVKPVLKDLTGILRCGRLTLVLGPPGCGKTSYLKAISGKLHFQKGVSASVEGEVRYNWTLVEHIKKISNWAAYVGQIDEHLPLLTTRETIEFAWKCRNHKRLHSEEAKAELERRVGAEAAERLQALDQLQVEFILAVLGLSNCAETIIGNAVLKGVSGGEKRRVTLGEMLVTGTSVAALDEISTGLDSAATFDICKYLSMCAHFLNQVIVVALLQPPPEVVELFDDIVLLAEGNVIYHGPRENILEYFEKLGYRCPPRKDLGDFLQELPTANGAAFLIPEAERAAVGAPSRPPRSADEFGDAWKQSPEGRQLFEDVANESQSQFESEEARLDVPASEKIPTRDDIPENDFLTELYIVLAWAWSLKLRGKAEIAARIFQNFFMGLIFGSLFWQIGFDEWYLKAMLFSQMPSFMQAGGMGQVSSLVQQRGVLYKHTEARFFGALSFALSQLLVQIPFSIFDAMVFGNMLYWMCGLVVDFQRYCIFMLLAILFGLGVNQMMRFYAYVSKNNSSAFVLSVMTYLLFVIFSGQIATPGVFPAVLKWLFWMNPLAWVYRAMAINEFKADKYGGPGEHTCKQKDPRGQTVTIPLRCGDFFLQNRQFETDEAFVPYAVYVLLAYLGFFLLLTIYAIAKVRYDRDYTEQEESQVQVENENGELLASAGDGDDIRVQTSFGRTESLAVESKTLVFSDLWYTITLPGHNGEPTSVDLLKGVSGWAVPGRMTALMGSSGAGKSTLLDVLADRKTTGAVNGHILVNGEPPRRATFRKMVGYVEQFGVHANQATVQESLLFSARLRLPPRSLHKLDEFVNETMELLELDPIKDELALSLSVEENKRLTIAVELVANPSILFADEPTSGLDARAAAIVMRSIQNVARSGRTVICTIHQPSIAVFSMFDDLLLLRRGGSVVFFGELGENSKNLIRYFEAIPGTPACPVGYNPATWMLEVIGAGTARTADNEVDYAAIYRKSKLQQQNRERLRDEFKAPDCRDMSLPHPVKLSSSMSVRDVMAHGSSLFSPLSSLATGNQSRSNTEQPREFERQYSVVHSKDDDDEVRTTASFQTQVFLLLKRVQKTYWRSPEFSLSRLLVILFVGIIITSIFWQQEYTNAAETQSRVASLSFMITLGGAYNLYTIMPFTIERRALFYRERASGMYSALAVVISNGFVEVPYLIMETILGVNVAYWGIGFNPDLDAFMYYMLLFFVYIFMMTSLGMLFAEAMPDALSAQLVASVLVQIFQLFAGTIVPHDKLPVYYKFLYYFSPQMWCTSGLVTTQFHGDKTPICVPSGKIVTEVDGKPHTLNLCSLDGTTKTLTPSWLKPPKFSNITGMVMTAEDYVYAGETAYLKGYSYSDRNWDLLVLLGWLFVIRILTGISVIYINHNKR